MQIHEIHDEHFHKKQVDKTHKPLSIKQQASQQNNKKSESFFKTKKNTLLISQLIDKFLFYLQYEKNVSPKTLENYSLWLNRFLEFM
jgi:hypothetical protein